MVIWLILSKPLLLVEASPLPLLVSSSLTKIRVLVGTFILACPIALAAASMRSVLPDRWFTPHFAVCAEFALSSWDATVERARIHSPLWPACWLDCRDRSRSSQSPVIRDIWDVYIREVGFVPLEVRTNLFRLCNS